MARKEVEVLLPFGREVILIILRPVQITGASENECWPCCCSGRRVACNFYCSGGVCLLRVEWDAGES
jgi:hypothetical protein